MEPIGWTNKGFNNGTVSTPVYEGIYKVEDVNGLVNGNTLLITVPSDVVEFAPTDYMIKVTAFNGATMAPNVSIGSNTLNYDNIVAYPSIYSLSGTSPISSGKVKDGCVTVSGGESIYVKISSAPSAIELKYSIYLKGIITK